MSKQDLMAMLIFLNAGSCRHAASLAGRRAGYNIGREAPSCSHTSVPEYVQVEYTRK